MAEGTTHRESEPFRQQLSEIIHCPLCLEAGENRRSLPCQHWLCVPCLRSLIRRKKTAGSGGAGRVLCPVCRSSAQIPSEGASGFPVAFLVNQLYHLTQSASPRQPKQKIQEATAPDSASMNQLYKVSHVGRLRERKVPDRQFDVEYVPTAAACAQDGRFIIREYWSRKLHIHRSQGSRIKTLTTSFFVHDIKSFQDKFYVTERVADRGRVFVYNSQPNVVDTFEIGYKGKSCLAVTDNFLFVTSPDDNKVYRADMPLGGRVQALITGGLAQSLMHTGPRGPMFIGTNGHLIAVTCFGMRRVFVYSVDGVLQYSFGDDLNNPWGVALDKEDRLLICDSSNSRVRVVSPGGQILGDIIPGHDLYPLGVTLTPSDDLLLACHVSRTGKTGRVLILDYQYSLSHLSQPTDMSLIRWVLLVSCIIFICAFIYRRVYS